ncbi:putative transcription factor C2H2 family [Helianthus anomalus]
MNPLTHRCNSCNTDLPTNTEPLCPNCTPNPNPNHLDPPSNPTVTTSDDNFLLDSPYLHRLLHHLTHSNNPTTTTTPRYHSPTSKSAINSIPTVTITPALLHTDPIILCAICKDQFVINDVTKQLPCKHMYHPDCIIPWLINNNSCPVCRFQMPKEAGDVKAKRRTRSRVFRLEDFDDESMSMDRFSVIAQTVEVDVLPDSDGTGGRGNVSDWRDWPVNGQAVDGANDADVGMP